MVNKRFLAKASEWRNPEVSTGRPKLTKILERDETEKPILNLTPIEKIAVNTPTQGDYWDLMRVYELGDWKWFSGILPTQKDYWHDYGEEACIDAGANYWKDRICDEGKFCIEGRKIYLEIGWEIISPQEFYQRQNITPEMLLKINKWFDRSENAKS